MASSGQRMALVRAEADCLARRGPADLSTFTPAPIAANKRAEEPSTSKSLAPAGVYGSPVKLAVPAISVSACWRSRRQVSALRPAPLRQADAGQAVWGQAARRDACCYWFLALGDAGVQAKVCGDEHCRWGGQARKTPGDHRSAAGDRQHDQ